MAFICLINPIRILKHNVEGKLNDYLTFTLFRYIAIIPVDGKDMAITRSENSKIRIDTNHNVGTVWNFMYFIMQKHK